MRPAWIVPDWPAPPGVRAAATLRTGGVSSAPWDTLNLGDHVGDDPARVGENRRLLGLALGLPSEPAWLDQVHGRQILHLATPEPPADRTADGAVTSLAGTVLAVLTADCLPVLFCSADGCQVGIAHAGWRGLVGGVLEATVAAMQTPASGLLAWIGPGIGVDAYEVGSEVREACLQAFGEEAECYLPPGRPGRWQLDLAGLARHRLEALGVSRVHGGRWCTYSDPARFFSHRRDGAERPTGRMATLIWRT